MVTRRATPPSRPPTTHSDALSASLGALKGGELFVMLHTTSPDALPGTPGITIGGRIVTVPEPATAMLAVLAGVVLADTSARAGRR